MSTKHKEAPVAVMVEGGHLVPADAFAQEEIEKLPRGARFHAYLTLAKAAVDDEHGRLLIKYMAGIRDLYDWLPCTGPGTEYPTPNHVRHEILKQINFCTLHPQRDGTVRKEPLSMARDALSFEDLQVCMELSRLYAAAWTEHLTGTRYEPWEEYEKAHPQAGQHAP